MALNGGILFPTFLVLSQALATGDDKDPHLKKKKCKHPKGPPFLAGILNERIETTLDEGEREALEELRAALAVVAIRDSKADEKKREGEAEAQNLDAARANGLVADCGCCFDEYAINRMVHCNGEEVHVSDYIAQTEPFLCF